VPTMLAETTRRMRRALSASAIGAFFAIAGELSPSVTLAIFPPKASALSVSLDQ
jgi:hypothetical protein